MLPLSVHLILLLRFPWRKQWTQRLLRTERPYQLLLSRHVTTMSLWESTVCWAPKMFSTLCRTLVYFFSIYNIILCCFSFRWLPCIFFFFFLLEPVPCNNEIEAQMVGLLHLWSAPASLLCFERVYYSLISIVNPASRSQYNFILGLKLHWGKWEKWKRTGKAGLQWAMWTACSTFITWRWKNQGWEWERKSDIVQPLKTSS